VQVIFDGSRQTYGAPRVHQALRQEGTRCSRKRVARLMSEQNLQGRHRRRWRRTTVADPEAKIAAEDLIGRHLQPAELDVCWAGDITYVWTWEGWMYLASVIDLGSRRVVGWAMADHMRADLVCDALRMALNQRRPKRDLIFHSDRGSQYTSKQFTRLLSRHGGPAEPVATAPGLGQRGRGVVLLDAEGGAHPPARLADSSAGPTGRLRVRGGLVTICG
jgi:putative transposase